MVQDRFMIRANGEDFGDTRGPSSPGTDRRLRAGLGHALPELLKAPVREALNERHRFALLDHLARIEPRPSAVFELYKYGSELGHRLSERRGVPLVLYYDAPEVVQYRDIEGHRPPSARRAARRERESIRSASAVIAYSEPVRRYLLDTHGCDPARIHLFQTLDHSRMTYEESPAPRQPPTIGYVGSFMHWHRLCDLIEAFDLLRSGGTDAKLLLIGSGMARPAVDRRVLCSPHRNDIELTGFLDGASLAERKRAIDIAVLPGTMWYNLPTKIFEYGSGMRATIAPDSPTVRSLFRDGEELLLFRERDPGSMAAALGALARSSELRIRIGRSLGAKIRSCHSAELMSHFYSSLFDQVAGAPGIPRA
jgi:glycosyltransferase involved in cell wall biosynthesis